MRINFQNNDEERSQLFAKKIVASPQEVIPNRGMAHRILNKGTPLPSSSQSISPNHKI